MDTTKILKFMSGSFVDLPSHVTSQTWLTYGIRSHLGIDSDSIDKSFVDHGLEITIVEMREPSVPQSDV